MRRYKWTKEKISEAKKRYLANEPIEKIARDFDVSGPNVAQVLKEEGAWERRRKELTEDEWNYAVGAYRSGESIKVIARKLNRNACSFGDKLRKALGKRIRVYTGCRRYSVDEGF